MPARQRVVILGGGIAGLSAAWRLSSPEFRDRVAAVTVYQRGARLGGKGASSRGADGRIEEHGLHVWPGYYDNAFALVRACYEELDRRRTDPACPILDWDDAFFPAPVVGVADRHGDRWGLWSGCFTPNDLQPGAVPEPALDVDRFVRRAVGLVADFFRSVDDRHDGVYLTASPRPPGRAARDLAATARWARAAELSILATLGKLVEAPLPLSSLPVDRVQEVLGRLRRLAATRLAADEGARRTAVLADLLVTAVIGLVADGVASAPEGFASLDDEEFSAWLARHGALPSTLDSGLVVGLYDLVFGYEDADHDRRSFPAGLGLFLAGKLFFDYKGALFWKMRAGMGDVVFAPLYQALRARGVRFELFCRVDALELAAEGADVERIAVGRQATVRGDGCYEPLVSVGGLPCFPSRVDLAQLEQGEELLGHDLESVWCEWPDVDRLELARGRDFDAIVFAIPLGMVPVVARDLVARVPGWAEMVREVPTVATQSLQLWFRAPEARLGWQRPSPTTSGYPLPFETAASMSHVLDFEAWAEERPRAVVYLCSSLAWDEAVGTVRPSEAAHALVREHALEQVARGARLLFPGACDATGSFDWGLLHDPGERRGAARLDGQYWRANVDPSDRYVRSAPGSGRYRLAPDGSGVGNLFLAGDWVACGLDAGCIEAAVMAGVQAANAVLGLPRREGVLGSWPGEEPAFVAGARR